MGGFRDPVYWTKNLEGYGILTLKFRGIRDICAYKTASVEA